MPGRQPRRRSRRARSGRGRVILIVALLVLLVLAASLRGIAGLYTDYLWFKSLHQSGVWSGVLGAKVALALIFTVVFFAILWCNLFIADRVSSTFRPMGHDDELVLRFQEAMGHRMGALRFGISALFALVAGAGMSGQWNNWILFTHRVDFPSKDATFHTNIGFYVFQLPFLVSVVGWLFGSLLVVLLVTAVAHYFNGGIQVQGTGPLANRVTAGVKAHLSVLLALLALVKTGGYWLQRYQLVFSTRGTVHGATYTDVNVQLKAIYLLIMISLFAVALFIVNIWRRGWVLPVLAVGLWAFVQIVAGAAVPAFVQRFRVNPAESRMERPYIEHNIAATRLAFGLDKVRVKSFSNDGKIDDAGLRQNANTVQNVRLWDPNTVKTIFTRLQGIRSFYSVPDVDVDRYTIDGRTTQVMLSGRSIDASKLPQSSWEATHLAYTHGYGAIVAPANASDRGRPNFVTRNIPVKSDPGAPVVKQPGVYIGEGQSGYAIVKSGRTEIDFTDAANRTKSTSYAGKDGVKIGSGFGGFLRRAAFWLRFGNINPLISSNVKADSKVLYERDVRTRLEKLAPFLTFDSDPYLIVGDNGDLQYIVDAYTTTSHYPNSQSADTTDQPPGSNLTGNFNYVRNSVKAVVDTYQGTVAMYVVDPTDPIIRSYESAFPHLFTPASAVSDSLRAHFRYPDDLFRVQTDMYGRYHIKNPDEFYTKADAWQVSADPNQAAGGVVYDRLGNVVPRGHTMDPYYLLMRLPGEDSESFLSLRPFVPQQGSDANTQVLTAFMTAQSDPHDYGTLDLFTLPANDLPDGPYNVVASMMADPAVSSQQSLLCNNKGSSDGSTGGSECDFGSTLVIPVTTGTRTAPHQSLLYVRPWYVRASGNALPELDYVIVSYSDAAGHLHTARESTFHGALVDLFGPDVPDTQEVNPPTAAAGGTSGGGGGSTTTTTTTVAGVGGGPTTSSTTTTVPPTGDTVAALVARLNAAFDKADADLRAGDLQAYARDVAAARTIARQLEAKQAGAGGTTTTTVKK